MKTNTHTLPCALFLGLLTSSGAFAKDPYAKADDSWISISGEVKDVTADAFKLDYGDGEIIVEMDDWDSDADGFKLVDGDKVNVYGYVDDDLYETRSIEAGSVYVESLGTYFYASSEDEEGGVDVYPAYTTAAVVVPGALELTGTVTEVTGREFTIDTGTSKMTVDTVGMSYNPMDDEGFQKISKDDRVRVYGNIDVNLFEKTEFAATTVVTLKDASRK